MENNLRLDDLQINNLKIWQNPDLFCFGTDAVLLANFARPKSKDTLLDIGTGNCIIPILISAKSDIKRMTALEIQKECADLSQKNVDFNNLNEIIKVVHGDINDEKFNQTRFLLIGKKSFNRKEVEYKTSINFETENKSGALSRILQILEKHNISMSHISSRPSKRSLGEYSFYIDFEGKVSDLTVDKAIFEILQNVKTFKHLGSYPVASKI